TRALEHLVRCHQVWRLGPRRALQLASRCPLLGRLGLSFRRSAAIAIAVAFILVTALSVLAVVAHRISFQASSAAKVEYDINRSFIIGCLTAVRIDRASSRA